MLLLRRGPARGQRPAAIYGVNWDSSLAVGLQSWVESTAQHFLRDYGPLGLVPTIVGSPTLVASPLGGVNLYYSGPGGGGTATGGFDLPQSGINLTNTFYTVRMVFTPVVWTPSYALLCDSASRNTSAFFFANGVVSYNGTWLTCGGLARVDGGFNTPFTAGSRYDIVMMSTSVGGGAISGKGYFNGVFSALYNTGGGAMPAFNSETVSFGSNPSGSSTGVSINFECIQQWNRQLTDEEVWRLYDPPTRWDLYRPLA